MEITDPSKYNIRYKKSSEKSKFMHKKYKLQYNVNLTKYNDPKAIFSADNAPTLIKCRKVLLEQTWVNLTSFYPNW